MITRLPPALEALFELSRIYNCTDELGSWFEQWCELVSNEAIMEPEDLHSLVQNYLILRDQPGERLIS